MEDQKTEAVIKQGTAFKDSLLFKLLAIGFLVLVLLIPNAMIQELIRERQNRQMGAVQEVSASWGGPQTIVGPVLSIPYLEWTEYQVSKERTSVQRMAHFLPLQLEVEGQVDHQVRKRGIFDVILFQSDLVLKGVFEQPDFAGLHIAPEDILWDQAKVSLGISGMQGIKNMIAIDWAGQNLRMEPGTANPGLMPTGISVEAAVKPDGQRYAFSVPLKVNGSEALRFEPVGKETRVTLRSGWSSPSFEGNFLPDTRETGPNGFTATWQVFDLNRSYPQSWTENKYTIDASSFGVRLIEPVDEYAKNERSAKYAILIIGLTFLIYFFFETLRRFNIHPFQYLLVGLALSIFYLLLLSLSEQVGFDRAYLIAAGATVGLIVAYSGSVFKSRIMVVQLGLLLALIYGFIFVILQLEDFALLAGSLGLFAALAAVMYYSRRVDWYHVGRLGEGKR